MSFPRLPDEFVQELLDGMETMGRTYALAKARRAGLEEQRKMKKNELMVVAEEGEDIRQFNKQERFAYSHPAYRAVVDEYVAAVQAEAEAEYALELFRMRFEAWRTVSANDRATLR